MKLKTKIRVLEAMGYGGRFKVNLGDTYTKVNITDTISWVTKSYQIASVDSRTTLSIDEVGDLLGRIEALEHVLPGKCKERAEE